MKAPELRSAAPVFQVPDVQATLRWYETHLGFKGGGFPKSPPFAFGILSRDAVEIMLQHVEDAKPVDSYGARSGGVWHVYLRIAGVQALYEEVRQDPEIQVLEELKTQFYGEREFVVRDPNGYVLVFSERVETTPG
jgi:catechol 2,3-dioxygenase-like lactoylglutathione lyase family enzyme